MGIYRGSLYLVSLQLEWFYPIRNRRKNKTKINWSQEKNWATNIFYAKPPYLYRSDWYRAKRFFACGGRRDAWFPYSWANCLYRSIFWDYWAHRDFLNEPANTFWRWLGRCRLPGRPVWKLDLGSLSTFIKIRCTKYNVWHRLLNEMFTKRIHNLPNRLKQVICRYEICKPAVWYSF